MVSCAYEGASILGQLSFKTNQSSSNACAFCSRLEARRCWIFKQAIKRFKPRLLVQPHSANYWGQVRKASYFIRQSRRQPSSSLNSVRTLPDTYETVGMYLNSICIFALRMSVGLPLQQNGSHMFSVVIKQCAELAVFL
jgi:hypothetical protein